MTRFLNSLALVVILSHGSAHATDQCQRLSGSPGATAVLAHVCLALSAVNKGDAKALQDLMADDFALTSVSGKYFGASKQSLISRWTEPPSPGTSAGSNLSEVFRVYQSATFGFVVGEIEDMSTEKQVPSCTVHAFTDIWELREKRWLWVESHESGYRSAPCSK